MVNNRQKSTVSSLKWANDGEKIAIAYEDGLFFHSNTKYLILFMVLVYV